MRKKCSSDREKLLKLEAEVLEFVFKKKLRQLEQLIFETECFLTCDGRLLHYLKFCFYLNIIFTFRPVIKEVKPKNLKQDPVKLHQFYKEHWEKQRLPGKSQ